MPKLSIFYTIAIGTLLGACSHSGSSNVGIATKNTPVADATDRSGSEWLIGNWVPKGYNCQSDSGVEFKSDGTYTSADSSGRWTLVENTLTYFTTETDEVASDQPSAKIPNPKPYPSTIRRISSNEYLARPTGAKSFRLTRC